MSDSDVYNTRLEQKIDTLQKNIEVLNNQVFKQNFSIEGFQHSVDKNTKRVDVIEIKQQAVEMKSATQDGAIAMLRYLVGCVGGVLVGACMWVGSSIIQLSQDTTLQKEKITRLELHVQNHDVRQ